MGGEALRLVQLVSEAGRRAVGVPQADGRTLALLKDTQSVYELAQAALQRGAGLAEVARERIGEVRESYDRAAAEQRLLPPLDHPDPAHCWVTGTGLTHRQSAQARDDMHKDDPAAKKEAAAKPMTDSMRIYEMGVEGGKPAAGKVGVQPEWFYKGDGSCLVGSERPLQIPDFSLDGSEEPEVVGLYIIDDKGAPCRLGYTLGNELSDHIMERQNYLYLAHSKLRVCSAGPELVTGALPESVEGTSRVLREGKVLWEKPVRSGEANMTHSLANLEHHHFKYAMFRRPGDVHVHYFGAMSLSFADGVRAKPGDVFELEVPLFGRPLRNPLAVAGGGAAPVRAL